MAIAALAADLEADCEEGALDALARKCSADLKAWSRFARGGSTVKLEASLAGSDAKFERGYAKSCQGAGQRDPLRLLSERPVEELRAREELDVAEPPAELLRTAVTFAKGEREKRLWLPMPGDGSLLFEREAGLHATLYDGDGQPLGVAGELEAPSAPGAAALALPGPEGHRSVLLRRSGDLRRQRTVTLLLGFDDPATAFTQSLGFFSPLRAFLGGEDLYDLPVGSPFGSFDAYVAGEWGYLLSEGREALEWFALEPLFFGLCPAAAPGATPPPGASHDQNECGISTFIHSMQSQFPGALPADVATDPKKWDAVGDQIGHSNVYGTPLLGKNVEETFSGAKTQLNKIGPHTIGVTRVAQPSATKDGKFYCAGRIGDESPANLAAWGEDCDLKLLAFDLPTFGHWLDVNAVTPDPNDATKATLELQDYDKSYDVACTHTPGTVLDTTQVDVSVDPAAIGSVLHDNFDAGDPVAGDEVEESISFWVVCECDRTDPLDPVLPTTTKSGKTLNP